MGESIKARRCERCKELKDVSVCYERLFENQMNETLCDVCVDKLIERCHIIKEDKNIYRRNMEQIYQELIHLETEEERKFEEIKYIRDKRRRLERVIAYYDGDVSER